MSMTRAEAAQLLQVPVDATPQQVNTAYRKCIAKYHPDANRNKSPEEQKQAEAMFKKCSEAKKIMLAPPKPEVPQNTTMPSQQTSNVARNTAYQPTTQRQPSRTNQQRTVGYTTPPSTGRTSYNTAKTFVDNVERVPDDAERQIVGFYTRDAKKMYKTKSDLVRITPSILVSIAYIALTILLMFLNQPLPGEPIVPIFANPLVWFAGGVLLKIIIYDTFISYYLHKLFRNGKFTWLIQCGAESILTAIGYIAISIGTNIAFNMIIASAGMVVGVLLLAGGIGLKVLKSTQNK